MLPVDGHQAVLLVDLLGAKQALSNGRQSWDLYKPCIETGDNANWVH